MKMISFFILLTWLSASAFAGVPARLLDSIAFVESRMNPENIMGLSDDKASPHSFEKATLLTGYDEQTLRNDPVKNRFAAEAILDALQKEMKTEDWRAVLARYSGFEDVASSFYVDDVMNAMNGDAESAQLVGDSIGSKNDKAINETAMDDISGAPPVVRFPADLNNFTQNAPNACFNPRFIVIHDTEGGFAGALQTLRHGEPGKMRSANYLIRSSDGLIAEIVDPGVGYAWHAKNWNPYAIGVEHEARNMKEPGWYTAKMYRASVKLVLYLSEKYKIPLDPDHVFGHNFWQMLEYDHSSMKSVLDSAREPQRQDHVDPGYLWRWDLYFAALHGFDDAFNHLRSKPKAVFHKVR